MLSVRYYSVPFLFTVFASDGSDPLPDVFPISYSGSGQDVVGMTRPLHEGPASLMH
jgi:hypothetical protein